MLTDQRHDLVVIMQPELLRVHLFLDHSGRRLRSSVHSEHLLKVYRHLAWTE